MCTQMQEYQHITSDLMTSLLQIGQDVPALAPDLPDQPDGKVAAVV